MTTTFVAERALPLGALLDLPALAGRPAAVVAEILGIPGCVATRRRHMARLKVAGLNVWEADRFATALFLHPSAIWGAAFDEAMDRRIAEYARTKTGAKALVVE